MKTGRTSARGIAFQPAGPGRIPDVGKGAGDERDAPQHDGDGQGEALGIGAEAPERRGQGHHAVQQPLQRRGGGQQRRRHDADQDVQDDPGRRGPAQLPPLEQPDDQQDGQQRPDGAEEPRGPGPAEQEQPAHQRRGLRRPPPVHDQERRHAAAQHQQELQPQRRAVDERSCPARSWRAGSRGPSPGSPRGAAGTGGGPGQPRTARGNARRRRPAPPSNTIRPASTTRTRSMSRASSRSWVDMMICWLEAGQGAAEQFAVPEVQQRGGLVQHQHVRVHGQHGGQGQQLAFPAGELVDALVGQAAAARSGPGRPRPGCRRSVPFRTERRRDSSTSSRPVGMTSWDSGSVKTKPTCRRTARTARTVSAPSTVTVPPLGATRPLSSRSSVDLPEPLAPITPIRRSVRLQRDVLRAGSWAPGGRRRPPRTATPVLKEMVLTGGGPLARSPASDAADQQVREGLVQGQGDGRRPGRS